MWGYIPSVSVSVPWRGSKSSPICGMKFWGVCLIGLIKPATRGYGVRLFNMMMPRASRSKIVSGPVGCIQLRDQNLALRATGMNEKISSNVDADMGIGFSCGIEKNKVTRLSERFIKGWERGRHVISGSG